ncbi:CHC2 zinc finger domain-containing protein [Spirillospora sp. NPDC047279]|uniref:CHC2 zinc finger domain-containing protein n=1 Tax=Spirillospora sp. NPDC047279 TaxID=3155478 RepID=UPI0033D69941
MDIDIVPILEHYGADLPDDDPREFWTSVVCPFHPDTRPSASYNEYAFNCFSCGVKGDALALIMREEDLDFVGAIGFAERLLGEGIEKVPRRHHTGRRRVSDGARDQPRDDREVQAGSRFRPSAGP